MIADMKVASFRAGSVRAWTDGCHVERVCMLGSALTSRSVVENKGGLILLMECPCVQSLSTKDIGAPQPLGAEASN
eukprot:6763838-Prymnesium_polylepis.2